MPFNLYLGKINLIALFYNCENDYKIIIQIKCEFLKSSVLLQRIKGLCSERLVAIFCSTTKNPFASILCRL